MAYSRREGTSSTEGEDTGRCVSSLPRALILEIDPVHRRVMRRLMALLGFEVSATGAVEDARAILMHEPVRYVLLGCGGPDHLDRLLIDLGVPDHVNVVVVSSQELAPIRRGFTFIRRPFSWPELRRAIRRHEMVGM